MRVEAPDYVTASKCTNLSVLHRMKTLAGCPSGQWEGTVNPPALPSKVQILHPPPVILLTNQGSTSYYLVDPAVRAVRDPRAKNRAKTSAKTIPVLTPISLRARLKYSVVLVFSIVSDAPTVRM